MVRRRYRFLPHPLEFRRLSPWHFSQVGKWLIFLLTVVGLTILGAYALFYFWPSAAVRKARDINLQSRQRLLMLTEHRNTLQQLTTQADSLEKSMYNELIPPTDSAPFSAHNKQELPSIRGLSEDTLRVYLSRVEADLLALVRIEAILHSPEIRSSRLPRQLPCACEELAAGFGTVLHPVLGTSYPHRGVDFLTVEGTVVWATAEGVVAQVEKEEGSEASKVYIQHTRNLRTVYYPLHPRVQVGQWVAPGTPIGTVQRIPLARAPFLHYEVWVEGEPTDPLLYLWGAFSWSDRQRYKNAFERQSHALH